MNQQKEKFFLSPDTTYLNCAYMSPLLKSVEEAGIAGIRIKRDPSGMKPEDFFAPVNNIRELFAKLIHVNEPNRICLTPSVSYGLASVANNIRIVKGDNIVILEAQFPSNYYVWKKKVDEAGAELRIVGPPAFSQNRGKEWNEQILAAIDENSRVVALPHVHWADGTVFDLKKISKKVHSLGGLLVVDGTQSFGAFPFDQGEINADALVVSGYKWLMGPYGIALAFFGEFFDQGDPIEDSWMNRVDSDNFAGLVDYNDQYRSGAKRYEVGEASNFIHVPMMKAALEQLNEWDPAEIQSYCEQITEGAIEELRSEGFWIEKEESRAKHLFGIRLPEGISVDSVREQLKKEKVIISIRGNAIRVSPHVYNSQDDIQKLANVLVKNRKGVLIV